MRAPVLILQAQGTNRDREAAWACELAGGAPEIVPIKALVQGRRALDDFRMLVLPGGFSYGDDLGAGKVWALTLKHALAGPLARFIEAGRPVLGICNGFQALIKAGLLGGQLWEQERRLTLTHNASGRFECRWVRLEPEPQSRCIFTRGLTEPILCPVAHGEGRLVARDAEDLAELERDGRIALRYGAQHRGGAASEGVAYPDNPNGSAGDVAGICNGAGTVMGLMPHPEDHITMAQHPRAHRGERGQLGLALFEQGIKYAAQL